MPKSSPVQHDELLIISPGKAAGLLAIQKKLKSALGSELVRSVTKVSVSHVDNLAKSAVTLFDTKAILRIIFGDLYNMEKGKNIDGLAEQFQMADQSLDEALESSASSRKIVREITSGLNEANRRAREALVESRKIK